MSIVSNFVINNLKVAFLNVSFDVEVRIAAYLIYMKSDIKAPHLISVYEALKNEPVKQFKAFTYSHMSNILESEDPSVQRYVLYKNHWFTELMQANLQEDMF